VIIKIVSKYSEKTKSRHLIVTALLY